MCMWSLWQSLAFQFLQVVAPLVQVLSQVEQRLPITHVIIQVMLYLGHACCELDRCLIQGFARKLGGEKATHMRDHSLMQIQVPQMRRQPLGTIIHPT